MRFSITPLDNNVILKLKKTETKIGVIEIPSEFAEKSTLAEVMIPNIYSYAPNGEPREPKLKKGMLVRIPKGKVGTSCPEAPKGEDWICVPEDAIYYLIEENTNG